MLKLKDVDPKRVRAARNNKQDYKRGLGLTIARLLHILDNIRIGNSGATYLYIGENNITTQEAKEQLMLWLVEKQIPHYRNMDTIIVHFEIRKRAGLMGWWDIMTKPLPPHMIEIEFMCVELGGGKIGTKQIDEVIVDVSLKTRMDFYNQLAMAMATGKYVYV